MCGRFVNYIKDLGEWSTFFEDWTNDLDSGYNVSPTSMIPVTDANGMSSMRWGLVPHWSKEISSKYATFNARAESIDSKPSFRDAWKHKQRCLIPAQGYYEWRVEDGAKQPYFIHNEDDRPMVFGGIWDRWHSDENELHSCSIITLESTGRLAELHHRMPLLIGYDEAERWLDGDQGAEGFLEGREPKGIDYYAIDRRVNNSRSQGAELIQPI